MYQLASYNRHHQYPSPSYRKISAFWGDQSGGYDDYGNMHCGNFDLERPYWFNFGRDSTNPVEDATRAHVEAKVQLDRAKEKYEEAKKKYEDSDRKMKECDDRLRYVKNIHRFSS